MYIYICCMVVHLQCTVEQEFFTAYVSQIKATTHFHEFYFYDVKIPICVFYVSKLFMSISRLFHVRIVLLLSSMLHSLKNLVVACCFPSSSVYLADFSW